MWLVDIVLHNMSFSTYFDCGGLPAYCAADANSLKGPFRLLRAECAFMKRDVFHAHLKRAFLHSLMVAMMMNLHICSTTPAALLVISQHTLSSVIHHLRRSQNTAYFLWLRLCGRLYFNMSLCDCCVDLCGLQLRSEYVGLALYDA